MDVYQVLLAAASPDTNTRNQAEAALTQMVESNAGAYYLYLSEILADDKKEDHIRQLAGTQMKVTLDANDEILKERRKSRWANLDPALRKKVKDLVASAIGTEGQLARLAAAQVIAKIGAIEILPSSNGWPELVDGLISTASRTELPEGPRSAALTSLGYLFEELDVFDESPLAQEEVDRALTVICTCMSFPAVNIQRAALGALYNALPFVAENFEDSRVNERNSLMSAICNATQTGDDECKQYAFSCITRIAELYYGQLGPYMDALANLTATAARSPSERVSVAALEFWTQVAENELDLGRDDPENKHYIKSALNPLVHLAFDLMCLVDENAGDEDYGTPEAASAVMKYAALAVGKAIVDVAMPLINANFDHSDWRRRDAAVSTFGFILEDPEPDERKEASFRNDILAGALPHLYAKVDGPKRDPSEVVRASVLYTLSEVFSHHVEIVKPSQTFLPTLELLLRCMNDSAKPARFAVTSINNLVLGVSQMSDFILPLNTPHAPEFSVAGSVLSAGFFTTINQLMIRAERDDWDEFDIRGECYECISTVIESAVSGSPDQAVLLAFLESCLARLMVSANKFYPQVTVEHSQRDQEIALQTKLCAMINGILMKIEKLALPFADRIAEAIAKVLLARTSAAEEAFALLSSFCTSVVESDISKYISVLYPIIRDTIRNTSEYSACKAAILSLSSVSIAMGSSFIQVTPEVMTLLESLLSNADVMRSLKPVAFSAFSDVALAVGSQVAPYVPVMFRLLCSAAKLKAGPNDPEDLAEYVVELRESIMEGFTGVFQAFMPPENLQAKDKHAYMQGTAKVLLPVVGQFFEVIMEWQKEWAWHSAQDSNFRPVYSLLRNTVVAVGDALSVLGTQNLANFVTKRSEYMVSLMKMEKQMFDELLRDGDDTYSEPASRFTSQLLK